MRKRKVLIPVFVGLIVGQVFSEGNRPFHISNTIRFGYTDNVAREKDKKASNYVTDTIDLSFNAALSDRTDLTVKSQINLKTDTENDIYPNIYALLSHSVSPRLLLRLSEYHKRGEKSTAERESTSSGAGRHNYWENRLGLTATYVLDVKNRLEFSVNHGVKKHDKEIERMDSESVDVGVSWEREWIPQRTTTRLNLRQRWVEYDERMKETPEVDLGGTKYWLEYDRSDESIDSTELTVELKHTLNPNWQARVEGGVTYSRPDYRDARAYSQTLPAPPVQEPNIPADNKARFNPLFNMGLIYSPSPRTRVTGDYSYQYRASESTSQYGAETVNNFTFGVQHDLTAKILVKAVARYRISEFDQKDSTIPQEETHGKSVEELLLDLRLTYKLNRINFLELGLKHRELDNHGAGEDWDQNMIDIGWRVEL